MTVTHYTAAGRTVPFSWAKRAAMGRKVDVGNHMHVLECVCQSRLYSNTVNDTTCAGPPEDVLLADIMGSLEVHGKEAMKTANKLAAIDAGFVAEMKLVKEKRDS